MFSFALLSEERHFASGASVWRLTWLGVLMTPWEFHSEKVDVFVEQLVCVLSIPLFPLFSAILGSLRFDDHLQMSRRQEGRLLA